MRKDLATIVALSLGAAAFASQHSFGVREVGHGKPIILIPGLTCTGAVWDGTIQHLKDKYHCYVLTLPGFGTQPPIRGPYLSHVRDDIISFVRERRLQKPAVIGHSLGGFMVFDLGCSNPNFFGPLISVDGLPFLSAVYNQAATAESSKGMADTMATAMLKATHDEFQRQTKRALQSEITDPANVEKMYKYCKDSDKGDVAQAMKEMITTDLRSQVGAIKSPLLLIGAGQWATSSSQRERLKANYLSQISTIPSAKLVIDARARHFIMLDDPAFFYRTVDGFLKSVGY